MSSAENCLNNREGILPISPNQFKSFNDLIVYLNELEEKINVLEQENLALRNSMDQVADKHRGLAEFIRDNWPKGGMVSRSFWVRALTVYGHFFVIQLIISILLFICYLVILAPIVANALRNVVPNINP
jgi:hypothetical protein